MPTHQEEPLESTALDYDQLAAEYTRYRQVHSGALQALHQAVHSLQQAGPGRPRMLEAGCGTGNYILALAASTGCEGWGMARIERELQGDDCRTPIPCVSRYKLWGSKSL